MDNVKPTCSELPCYLPVHRRCYRCDQPVLELVNLGDLVGGQFGVCSDCRLRLQAVTAARCWRWEQGEVES